MNQHVTDLGPLPPRTPWMEEMGFEWTDLRVLRFLDDLEDRPWFYRAHEAVGIIRAICEAGHPLHPEKVLKVARETWGPDVSVMW